MCAILGFCDTNASLEVFRDALEKTISRGPDDSRIVDTGRGYLGFNRLAIMDLSSSGMQPFERDGSYAICNGEIYDFRPLRKELEADGYVFKSGSDCELILPLWEKYGTDMFPLLDAEYALIIYDKKTHSYIAARDPIGIRPLYYGYAKDGGVWFGSEPKNLVGLCAEIKAFPPGHYCICAPGKTMSGGTGTSEDGDKSPAAELTFTCYRDMTRVREVVRDPLPEVTHRIHDLLVSGVRKRLDADAPVGFLLSGGLDSSLVCAISASLMPGKKLRTWSIGMDVDAIDLKYARQVADFIGSEHHEVIISRDDVLGVLEEVIAVLGTWDITTIRASIGMYLLCKAIRRDSDVRVLLTGEISDELFGYKYTDFAPDADSFQKEAEKRVRELHMYDVLRADRCIAANSIEARVPFGDLDFVEYVMAIDPEMKLNRYGIGKYLLREAFREDRILPESILMREKAAFSDAVGHSLKDDLAEYAEACISDAEYEEKAGKYSHAAPFTKESLLYREIFEKYYPGQAGMIADFWMPNRSWPGCDVSDPSARVLKNYGKSGV